MAQFVEANPGATRTGFGITIQNPEDNDALVRITYMRGDATIEEKEYTVSAHSRFTVSVNFDIGEGYSER